MPRLAVAAATLGRYGACFCGASAGFTQLLCSASVAQIVAGSLRQPSGVEEASRAPYGKHPELSDSDCNSIKVSWQDAKSSPLVFTRSAGEVEQILLSIGCAQADGPEKILKSFRVMDKMLHVTSRTCMYRYLINKFSRLGQVSQAVELLEEMYNEKMRLHSTIFTPIITALSKKFLLDEASEAMAAMRRMKIPPKIKHYNILMQACAETGNMEKAYGVLAELQQHGESPGTESFNHIIKGFCRQKRFERAKAVLQEMEQAGMKPNSYTYSLLVHTCVINGDFNAAMKLINEMKDRGLETDKLTTRVVLSFKVNSGDLDNAMKVVNQTTIGGQHSRQGVKNQVLRRLALAGRLDEAYQVYQEIKVSSKSQMQGSSLTLLAAYGAAGELDRMVEIFEESICQGSCLKSPETYEPNYLTVSCMHMTLSFLRYNQLRRCAKFVQHVTEMGTSNGSVLVDNIFLHIASSWVHVNIGLALVKELRLLGIRPSRIAFEALLDCCILEGNSGKALEIEQEMEKEGLPLNVFSKIRMFGIFAAARNQCEALRMLDAMSSEDLREDDVQFLLLIILNLYGKESRGTGADGSLHEEVYRRLYVH